MDGSSTSVSPTTLRQKLALPILTLWGIAVALAIVSVYFGDSVSSSDERIVASLFAVITVSIVLLRYIPLAAVTAHAIGATRGSRIQTLIRRYYRRLALVVAVDLILVGLPFFLAPLYWPNRDGYAGLLWFALYLAYACVALIATAIIAPLTLRHSLRKEMQHGAD